MIWYVLEIRPEEDANFAPVIKGSSLNELIDLVDDMKGAGKWNPAWSYKFSRREETRRVMVR